MLFLPKVTRVPQKDLKNPPKNEKGFGAWVSISGSFPPSRPGGPPAASSAPATAAPWRSRASPRPGRRSRRCGRPRRRRRGGPRRAANAGRAATGPGDGVGRCRGENEPSLLGNRQLEGFWPGKSWGKGLNKVFGSDFEEKAMNPAPLQGNHLWDGWAAELQQGRDRKSPKIER